MLDECDGFRPVCILTQCSKKPEKLDATYEQQIFVSLLGFRIINTSESCAPPIEVKIISVMKLQSRSALVISSAVVSCCSGWIEAIKARMSSSLQLMSCSGYKQLCSSKACWVTVLQFLENKLKGLSYVALPRLFPVSYYFRPGSDGVGAGYPEVAGGGAGRRTGGRKAFHRAGKLKEPLSYQALADLAATRCLCSLHFPFLSPRFPLLLFFFPSPSPFLVKAERRLHLPSDVC